MKYVDINSIVACQRPVADVSSGFGGPGGEVFARSRAGNALRWAVVPRPALSGARAGGGGYKFPLARVSYGCERMGIRVAAQRTPQPKVRSR